MTKIEIIKTDNAEYPYNARIFVSVDGGSTWFYTGNGRFFRSIDEVKTWEGER